MAAVNTSIPRISWSVLAVLGLSAGLVGCSDDTSDPQNSSAATTTCEYPNAGQPAEKPVDLPETDDVPSQGEVTFTLDMAAGPVTITMDRAGAPCAINSFASLAEQGFYDNTQCHRLTTEGIFVLQCGDPSGTGRGGPGYSFADEEGGDYAAGTVAMANAGPDTNGSQFFLVYDDSPLPPDYTVLGHMDDASIEVVKQIAAPGSDNANGPGDGQPISDATITAVTQE